MILVLLALLIFIGIGGVGFLLDPPIGLLTALSIVPDLALTGYVWYGDITANEPFSFLAATFLLGVLMAGYAAVLNSVLQPYFSAIGIIGMVLFYFIIVGPVEETVKLLAVRLYAYGDDRFAAVIDGAVYGAIAVLGFATIENAPYISRALTQVSGASLGLGLIGLGSGQIPDANPTETPRYS